MSTDTIEDLDSTPEPEADEDLAVDEPDEDQPQQQDEPVADGSGDDEEAPPEVFPAGGILATLGNTGAIATTAAVQGVGGLGLLLISGLGALVSLLLFGAWRRRKRRAAGRGRGAGRPGPGRGRGGSSSRGGGSGRGGSSGRGAGSGRGRGGGSGRSGGLLGRLRGRKNSSSGAGGGKGGGSGKKGRKTGDGDGTGKSKGRARRLLDRLRGKKNGPGGKDSAGGKGSGGGKGGLLSRLRGRKNSSPGTGGKTRGKGGGKDTGGKGGLLGLLGGKKRKKNRPDGPQDKGNGKAKDSKKNDKGSGGAKPGADGGPQGPSGGPAGQNKPGSKRPDSTTAPNPVKNRPAVPVPGRRGVPTRNTGGSVMTFPIASAASEFRSAAGQYHPKDMFEYAEHVQQLPDVLIDLSEGIKAMTVRAQSQLALENGVVEQLGHLYQAVRNAIPAAAEIGPALRNLHDKDLARRENPRNGLEAEAGWNIQ